MASGQHRDAEASTLVAARVATHDADAVAALRAAIAFVDATLVMPRPPVETLERLAADATARLGPTRGWQRGTLLHRLGVVAIHEGAWDAAARALDGAEAAFADAASTYGVLITRYARADAARWRGDLAMAEAGYRAMLDEGTLPGGRRSTSAAFALFGLARLAFERDEPGRAVELLLEGLALGRGLDPQLHAEGSLTLAHVQLALGALGDAEHALAETERAGAGDVITPVARPVAALRAALALERDEHSVVVAWLAATAPHEPLTMGPGIHLEHVVRARALLSLGRGDDALAWLERVRDLAARHDRRTNLVELLVLEAVASLRTGRGARAVDALRRALELAARDDHLRPFVHGAAEVATLLPRLPSEALRAPAIAAFVARIEARLRPSSGVPPTAVPATNVPATAVPATDAATDAVTVDGLRPEPLSDRERTVLRLLSAGASNKAIARELGLSVNTVKTHVRNVYAKLGVRSRARLAALCRDLDLLR